MNGPVKAAFARNPSKPSEFRSVNGSIDVYFQPSLNADLDSVASMGASIPILM